MLKVLSMNVNFYEMPNGDQRRRCRLYKYFQTNLLISPNITRVMNIYTTTHTVRELIWTLTNSNSQNMSYNELVYNLSWQHKKNTIHVLRAEQIQKWFGTFEAVTAYRHDNRYVSVPFEQFTFWILCAWKEALKSIIIHIGVHHLVCVCVCALWIDRNFILSTSSSSLHYN